MKKLDGIKIALCQMKVIPGRPDLNSDYIIREIHKAAEWSVDIIVFPEMCVTGYFIGDLYEDKSFLQDVEYYNNKIREATKSGIAAIVGAPITSHSNSEQEKGENGFCKVLNAGILYSNGYYLGCAVKTLQPNYRMFNDDRHFFSLRKIAFEKAIRLRDLLKPIPLVLRNGRMINLGITLCEDMWHQDYSISPIEILAVEGADIIFNLSASPWTWQKNRKRHQIIKDIIHFNKIPFVYVNNTGIQNNGKNIMIFDGCSAVYDNSGNIIYSAPAYFNGTHDIVLRKNIPPVIESSQNDSKELYQALKCAIQEFFVMLPLEKRRMVVGISGGIDSALATALYVDALGPENVIGVNMPSKFNSKETQDIARVIALNLGISYEVRPIQKIVDCIALQTEVQENSLAYENIQARARMEILAARVQTLNCLFSANCNKIEIAFGYGTFYGDMAGALAVLGDLLKREVYQLADYLNREVFKREVIPRECFEIDPSAELNVNQKDPFDYGDLNSRGYHEEMVRAFVEFRQNPEWFLDFYANGLLEKELKLPVGWLKKLFPTARHFIYDLEKHWLLFHKAFVKRIQFPPIPIVSRRAFGSDLRESIISPNFTKRYFELRDDILSREPKRVVIYGGSFNPPCLHHRLIVMELLKWFDNIIIAPCGRNGRKKSLKGLADDYRKEMVLLNFGDLPNITFDFSDLDNKIFTPTCDLDKKYKELYSDTQIWHAVGGDLIFGGKDNNSEIQRLWKNGREIWQTLNFVIFARLGFAFILEDLPPNSKVLKIERLFGSSTFIRKAIRQGRDKEIEFLLKPEIYQLITKFGLYKD